MQIKTVLVGLSLAGALAAALWIAPSVPVSADTHGAPKRAQWQYQCFEASGVAQVTEMSNKMGEQGWEMVSSAGMKSATIWCFKRPLWKPTK